MDLRKLREIIENVYCVEDSAMQVYVRDRNSGINGEVYEIQLKKSYDCEGKEKSWIEIVRASEEEC